jgi:hypothetical protein
MNIEFQQPALNIIQEFEYSEGLRVYAISGKERINGWILFRHTETSTDLDGN